MNQMSQAITAACVLAWATLVGIAWEVIAIRFGWWREEK